MLQRRESCVLLVRVICSWDGREGRKLGKEVRNVRDSRGACAFVFLVFWCFICPLPLPLPLPLGHCLTPSQIHIGLFLSFFTHSKLPN